jgi:ribosomal protein L40E
MILLLRARTAMSELPPMFLLLVVMAVVFLLVATAQQHRRHSWRTQQRLCRACGTSHPSFARFCRRCGRQLV